MRHGWIGFLVLGFSLACGMGEPVGPSEPREKVIEVYGQVPDALSSIDLPYYGGRVQRNTDTSVVISYFGGPNATGEVPPTADELRAWYPEALAEAGWSESSRLLSGNGTLDVRYDLPDGRKATLTIRPEGTLWWVLIDIYGSEPQDP